MIDTFQWGTGSATDQTFSDTSPPLWTHTLNFSPAAGSITDATLELRHKGNVGSAFFGEVWALSTQGNIALGSLSNSSLIIFNYYTTQTFSLPSFLLPALPVGSWTLGLRLYETTGGTDFITLDYSKLSVTYEPVATPEPATLTLLGSGFAAAALWCRRRQKRQSL
ncbi:MAG TPA: PEP-CTERM sorting domain-containing protein [Vicinamibacterales bacterium]|nr:PEP-CTERM sorting domain-containing protein [Vicinamibacterales bacterium]